MTSSRAETRRAQPWTPRLRPVLPRTVVKRVTRVAGRHAVWVASVGQAHTQGAYAYAPDRRRSPGRRATAGTDRTGPWVAKPMARYPVTFLNV